MGDIRTIDVTSVIYVKGKGGKCRWLSPWEIAGTQLISIFLVTLRIQSAMFGWAEGPVAGGVRVERLDQPALVCVM